MGDANALLELHASRSAALAALGYTDGSAAAPPPLAVLYTQLQVAPLRRVFSWAVPSGAALAAVSAAAAGGAGVVEAGAGTGYWASLLRARGVDVVPYDAAPLHCADAHNGHHVLPGAPHAPPPFLRVHRADAAAAAAAHPDRALLLCWPPPESDADDGDEHAAAAAPAHARRMAADALAAYAGRTVIYVGEEQHEDGKARGATAGLAFHGALSRDWSLQARVPLPRWPGARDSLTVWRRRGAPPTAAAPSRRVAAPDDAAADDGEAAEAPALRAALLAHFDAAWTQAAAAAVLARAAAGGGRAGAGPEADAVAAAVRSAPFLRRMLLRALC